MAEAAQVAGESMLRSRVGLCGQAARQGAVPPAGMRLHLPTVLLGASPEALVRHHIHCAPSCSTLVVWNGRGSVGSGGGDGDGGAAAGAAAARAAEMAPGPRVFLGGALGSGDAG